MRWLEKRRGAKAVKVTFPEPTTDKPLEEQDILSFYEKALSANPGTKLLLLNTPQQLDRSDHTGSQDLKNGQGTRN